MSAVVVSDASPINYLALIGVLECLPRLFSSVLIPTAVARELSSEDAPEAVLSLMRKLPSWLTITAPKNVDHTLGLDAGESEAIALALELGMQPVLMDERKGRRKAAELGLLTVGTLALLEESARRGWLDFDESISRLQATTFRIDQKLIVEAKERLKRVK